MEGAKSELDQILWRNYEAGDCSDAAVLQQKTEGQKYNWVELAS